MKQAIIPIILVLTFIGMWHLTYFLIGDLLTESKTFTSAMLALLSVIFIAILLSANFKEL